MICEGCGASAPALKSVRWRNGESRRKLSLCDGCWLPISGSVWVVRGPVPCFGKCRLCGEWVSVNVLRDVAGGGRWDSPTGICPGCNGVGSPASVR